MSDEIYNGYAYIPVEDAADGTNDALRLISENLLRLSNTPVVPKFHEPPRQVYDGLLVFADGTNWDPGFGRGVYVWDSAIDIAGVLADGSLVGTIPAWAPVGGYSISLTYLDRAVVPPATDNTFISSNTATDNSRCTFAELASLEIYARHAGNTGTSSGDVTTSAKAALDRLHRVRMGVSESGIITVTLDNSTATASLPFKGTPSWTTIFQDAVAGIADEIFITRLVMTDLLGGDDRTYLLDDGITGDIIDSTSGQNGTWNNITAGNILTQQGAWVLLSNY